MKTLAEYVEDYKSALEVVKSAKALSISLDEGLQPLRESMDLEEFIETKEFAAYDRATDAEALANHRKHNIMLEATAWYGTDTFYDAVDA